VRKQTLHKEAIVGYENRLKSKEADDLFEAVLTLDSLDECYRFFEDLCTVKEIKAMAQRFEVAKLLIQKKTYNEIEAGTGASTATISRINRTLQYGADGYSSVLKKMEEVSE
jgi:TrpR-related protein YerC/YecD